MKNFAYVTKEAYNFLRENKVSVFPLDFSYLADRMDIELIPYSIFPKNSLPCLCTQDGFTVLTNDGIPKIIYNDKQPTNRIHFTIAHEIGHIKLMHIYSKINTFFSNIIREQEANCFARNILAPFHEVLKLENINPFSISKRFGISVEASSIRLQYLKTDMYNFNRTKNNHNHCNFTY